MTQRDPAPDPTPEPDPAKPRFFMIQAMRLGGVLFVFAAIMILSGKIPGPPVLGYGLLILGMIEFFAMPHLLVQRWKSNDKQ